MHTQKKYLAGFIVAIFLSACGYVSKEEKLPYYNSASFTPQWLNENDADTIHRIPAFTFMDQRGVNVTLKDLDQKIAVVNFFFTSCPGICKRLTNNMTKVQDAFKLDDRIVLLSHSVTPDRDSIPVLAAYAAAHGVINNKWHLLTGSQSAIYTIARTGYFADEDLGAQQDSTTFLHTENILLVDGAHHIRGIYKGTDPAEINNLITDIRKLEKE